MKQKALIGCWVMMGLAFVLFQSLLQLTVVHGQAIEGVAASEQQPQPFLAVPYYNGAVRTAYMDNDGLPHGVNHQLLLYDGRELGLETHGMCNVQTQTPAYHAVPWDTGSECIWYDGHTGNDFALAYQPVLAAAAARLITSGWENVRNRDFALGLRVILEHENGYRTRYGHMSAVLTLTTRVEQGDFIGVSGNTGNSQGAHLHFEVLDEAGSFVDPFRTTAKLWEEGVWFAGQWAGQQQRPSYNITHVVDNDDPTFTKGQRLNGQRMTCPPAACPFWYREGTGGSENGDFIWTYDEVVFDYWAQWVPPEVGHFLVEAYIPMLSQRNPVTTTVTWGAMYCPVESNAFWRVFHKCVYVDQLGSEGRWIALGSFFFGTYPGQPFHAIWLDDFILRPEPYQRANVGVDALRFRGVRLDETVYLPTIHGGTVAAADR